MNPIDFFSKGDPAIVFSAFFLGYLTFFHRLNPALSVKDRHRDMHQAIFLWVLVMAVLLRVPNILNREVDVDTSTWLASALSIDHYPDKLWKLLNYTDSRPLTVLPLYLAGIAGLPVNYAVSECMALVFWCLSLYLTYRSFRYFLSSFRSLILLGAVALFIGSSQQPFINAYNSEAVSVLMVSICSYVYLHLSSTRYRSGLLLFLNGFLLGALIFAKFQNVPIGFVIAGFMAYGLGENRQWKKLALFIVAGILPTLLVNLIFLIHGSLDVFWMNYFWNYFEYSFTTHFQKTPVWERFYPRRVAGFLLFDGHSRFFFGSFVMLGLIGTGSLLVKGQLRFFFAKRVNSFAFLMTVVSLYAVLQSGNRFPHYLLYLILPMCWLIGVLSNHMKMPLVNYAVLGVSFQLIFNAFRPTIPPYPVPLDESGIVRTVQALTTPQDNIVIWGWIDRLHYLTRRPCGHRMAHMHQLFLDSPMRSYRVRQFLEDIDENKPALLLEDLKGIHTPIPELHKPITDFPAIRTHLHLYYTLHTTVDSIAIYKRK